MANRLLAKMVIGVLGVVGSTFASAVTLASTAQFSAGQVFASIGGGQVNVYERDGTFVQTLDTTLGGYTTGSTFDSAGNFYVTAFSSNRVSQFDSSGNLMNSNWATGAGSNESIVFDAAGNAYIGNASSRSILKVSSTGALLATYTTQQNTDWIDLAADGVTLLYSNEGSEIRQLNTSTMVDSAFISGSGPFYAKRYLADGGVLVASGTGNVYRYDSAGTLAQTYAIGIGGVFAMNLDGDGTSFWTGATGGTAIRRVDLASGAILNAWNTTGTLFGLSVFGELQAGGGGTGGGGGNTDVPEPGTMALLGLGLVATGLARRRKKIAA